MTKIAMDGPAGAGKSTVAKAVAQRLGFNYLDTGAMYRAAAYAMMERGVDVRDAQAVQERLPEIQMQIKYENGAQSVWINGQDVTAFLRTPQISRGASDIAVIPAVRLMLVELQREVARQYDIVMDGRDIGTYVLPDAEVKLFITASSRERARRRCLELRQSGQQAEQDEIEREIIARDETDSTREFAPLRQAEDAILVDTTQMDAQQVIEYVCQLIHKECGA